MIRPARSLAALVALAALGLTACHSSPAAVPDQTVTSTVVHTVSPSGVAFTPAPATTVAPLPPGQPPAAGEVEKRCPYIASDPSQNPTVNIETLNGSHVLRTTVLTRQSPVGCRFYFYAPPYQAIADILARRLDSPDQARNAIVLTARAGTQAIGQPHIAPGVDAVLYRTKFFAADGARDWACVFAVGATLVIVHTDRDDTSLNALEIAKAIAGKF